PARGADLLGRRRARPGGRGRRAEALARDLPPSRRARSPGQRRDRDRADARVGLHRARAMSAIAAPAPPPGWPAVSPLERELVKVSAFFLRNWRMTHRNVFTVFEIVFW